MNILSSITEIKDFLSHLSGMTWALMVLLLSSARQRQQREREERREARYAGGAAAGGTAAVAALFRPVRLEPWGEHLDGYARAVLRDLFDERGLDRYDVALAGVDAAERAARHDDVFAVFLMAYHEQFDVGKRDAACKVDFGLNVFLSVLRDYLGGLFDELSRYRRLGGG